MQLQFKILFFLVCLNLATGMAIALSLPGTEYVQASNPETPDYESHFNATSVSEQWRWTNYGVPILGDIYAAFEFLTVNLQFLIDGFPTFLLWISDTYITDVTSQNAFTVIATALRGLYAILMFIFVIEFISGRYITSQS